MRKIRYAVIILAIAVLSGTTSTAATAQEVRAIPPDVTQALDRLATTGTLSTVDRTVILAHPEIAARVIDPAARTERLIEPLAAAASVGCGPISRVQTERTLLGFVAWRLLHRINRCWNGTRITSTTNRQAYFYDVDFNFVIGAVNADSLNPGNGTGSVVTSIYSRQIQNCIAGQGCLSTRTPRITLTARGNGTFSTSGTNG